MNGMMNNEDMSIDEFVRMSPLAAPQGFFGNQSPQQLAAGPQYGVREWGDDKNCYIYALDWPGASNYWVFDVGDIYASMHKDIDLTDASYLQYKMKKMTEITGESYRDLIRDSAQRDGLIPVAAGEQTPPAQIPARAGHYLAVLYIDPDGLEHHWYRLDRSGYWSQKPGQLDPTNLDDSGDLIIDPRTAERGPWTMFGGFFYVPAGGGDTLFNKNT